MSGKNACAKIKEKKEKKKRRCADKNRKILKNGEGRRGEKTSI
jgi:hypothetical protein